MEITDHDLRLARQGAMSAHRSSRGLVPLTDLVGEANLWMVENLDKVELWREQGRHGQNKLRNACKQRCLTVVARERRKRTGLESGDMFYYTPQMIREILPDIFDPDDWSTSTSTQDDSGVKGPARPGEGNNRLAAIVDVRSAYFGLPQADRILLADLYQAGGLSFEVVAASMNVHERTVRRREERVIEKLVERLGGEPPGYRV
jgi:DNA-directed RNA polymerase specialized sigma24 family protein